MSFSSYADTAAILAEGFDYPSGCWTGKNAKIRAALVVLRLQEQGFDCCLEAPVNEQGNEYRVIAYHTGYPNPEASIAYFHPENEGEFIEQFSVKWKPYWVKP